MGKDEPSPSVSERLWLYVSAVVPAAVAAGQLDAYPPAVRDASTVRAVGLGYAGALRALDAWIAAPFLAVPIGTRAERAALPGALLLGLFAALVFDRVRKILVAVSGPSGWSPVVAALATATLSLSYPFQHDASAPGASVTAALCPLLALLLAESAGQEVALAGLSVLALSYEPMAGIVTVLAWLTTRLAARRPLRPPSLRTAGLCVSASLVGLAPFALAIARSRVTLLSTSAGVFTSSLVPPSPLGVSFLAGARHALGLTRAELGDVLPLLAGAGLAWSLAASPRARRAVLPAWVATLGAFVGFAARSRGSDDTSSPAALLTLAGTVCFASVAMHEAVLRTARARLPLAAASAAMVVVLEAAFPAVLLDDGLTRAAAHASLALPLWEDAAFHGLASGTLVAVSSPRLYRRLVASEAAGDVPPDVLVLPTFDPSNESSTRALMRDPRLVPLFRDLVLTGAPHELAMSTLAGARPLAVATDPRWERTLTRHLLPGGLLSLFEPEPRGGADRKRALEASAAARARLAKSLGSPTTPADAELSQLTVELLFDRAVSAAETGEREVAFQALEDARQLAPADPRMHRLAVAIANARGPVDVTALVPQGLAGEGPER